MRLAFDLLLITDERADLVERVERALAGASRGRVAVQLRIKGVAADALLGYARALREVTRRAGALLLVNDRVDVALAAGADGVHLPETGLPAEVARRLVGTELLVGCSCHDGAGLERAARAGADYATLAPVHAVPGKGSPLGVTGFAALAREARLPLYALGGLTLTDVRPLRAAGARGVAVIRHVMDAGDPARRVSELLAASCAGRPDTG